MIFTDDVEISSTYTDEFPFLFALREVLKAATTHGFEEKDL